MERESYSVEAGWHRYWNRHITELTTTTDQMMVEDPRIADMHEQFLRYVIESYPEQEAAAVSLTLRLATKHHHGVTRKEEKDSSGNPLPYISHPIDVATQLLFLEDEIGEKPPYYTLMAALFHDGPEDSTLETTGTAEKTWTSYLTGLFETGTCLPHEDVEHFVKHVAILQKGPANIGRVRQKLLQTYHEISNMLLQRYPSEFLERYAQPGKISNHSVELGILLNGIFSTADESGNYTFNPQMKWAHLTKALDVNANIWGKMTLPKIFRAAYMAKLALLFGAEKLATSINEKTRPFAENQGLDWSNLEYFANLIAPNDLLETGMTRKEVVKKLRSFIAGQLSMYMYQLITNVDHNK